MAEKLNTLQTSDLQALIQLVNDYSRTQPLMLGDGARPFVQLPAGMELVDVSPYLPTPQTARGSTAFHDLQSLIGYVNEERDDTSRAYYVAKPDPSLVVVLNDTRRAPQQTSETQPPHATGDRLLSWRDLRASFAYPLSEEWRRWNANHGKKMAQSDFALFIEQNLPDIVQCPDPMSETGVSGPSAAMMLEVSRSLEAKSSASFASALRLDNGAVEFKFEEQVQGTAAKGTLAIPDKFYLGIPVFENGEGFIVPAFLRYRVAGGSLTLWYELDRAHKILDAALEKSIQTFHGATGVPVYRGTPATGKRGE